MERKIFLSEKDMPTAWYNVAADFDTPMAPPLHPATKEPIGPDELKAIFPMNIIEQEVSTERWIEIPEPVREALTVWRPSPHGKSTRACSASDSGHCMAPYKSMLAPHIRHPTSFAHGSNRSSMNGMC